MKKIAMATLLSTAALMASENSTFIGGITGSLQDKSDGYSTKPSVSGFELAHHYTGNEGGMFAGKLTLDGSLSYISGKKDDIKRSDLEGKVFLGNQFRLTSNISVGPIMGIGADKYSINHTNYANSRETISTTYGAVGFSARAVPLENLKVSLNAYYKKSLIKPQYSWEGPSIDDFSKATGYTIEVPVEYKLTTTLGVYAKYTRDTMKFGESKDLPSFTKDHNLFSAGISYAW